MPKTTPIIAALITMLGAFGAQAATVDMLVRGADGRPVADAVVTIESAHRAPGPIRFPWPYAMKQQNITFVPHVLIVPVGASVTFPNLDRVRHHVYSFSKPKKFELKLYGQDETRSVVFDKPGVIAVGCNIHDQMSGYILVVTTPYAAKTDATGHVTLTDVPAGTATIAIWHPSIRGAGNMISEPATIPATGLSRTVSTGS